MTMLSFRVADSDAVDAQAWADRLQIDRSELLRQALRRHLASLAANQEAAAWQDQPLSEQERSFEAVADWGPAEDWSDWKNATG